MLLGLVAGLSAVLVGCGDDGLDHARRDLAAGRFERVASALEGREDVAAVSLRADLARRSDGRERMFADLEDFRARREQESRRQLFGELDGFLARAADGVERGWVEAEMSRTADWVAARDQGGRHPKVWMPGLGLERPAGSDAGAPAQVAGPESRAARVAGARTDPVLALVLADIEGALEESRWWRAMIVADLALEDAPEAAPRLLGLRDRALEGASVEARALLVRVRSVESGEGAAAARALLAGELWRFPDEGSVAELYRLDEELRGRLAALAAARARHAAAIAASLAALAETRPDTGAAGSAPRAAPSAGSREVEASLPAVPVEPSPERRAKLERLARRLLDSGGLTRDAALEELRAAPEGEVAANLIAESQRTLAARVRGFLVKGRALKTLDPIVRAQAELARRRAHALELIHDEETYFYPFEGPAVPPERTRAYLAVQREVDARVAAVRQVWEAQESVALPRSFRKALTDLRWLSSSGADAQIRAAAMEGLPAWVAGLDPERERVDLAGFDPDPARRRELARWRALRAWNEHRWEALGDAAPSLDARDQVRITNDYRVLLGRHPLAWSPALQRSAWEHSDYMARTGRFGHHEEEEGEEQGQGQGRRSPFDRMRAAGYERGLGENVYAGSSGGHAHGSWTRSSGHHRNILDLRATELGSANAGQYWTQNFGRGTAFESEFEAWRD